MCWRASEEEEGEEGKRAYWAGREGGERWKGRLRTKVVVERKRRSCPGERKQ